MIGAAVVGLAFWSMARTRRFCTTTPVTRSFSLGPPSGLDAPGSSRVSSTSTRSPGITWPPVPDTSFTETVKARIPGVISAARVARSPMPVSLEGSTGSCIDIGTRAVGGPPC